MTNQFSLIIKQLSSLKRAFPSSMAISTSINNLMSESLKLCTASELHEEQKTNDVIENIAFVKSMCTLLGTLEFASDEMLEQFSKDNKCIECCSTLLNRQFHIPNTAGEACDIGGWQIKAYEVFSSMRNGDHYHFDFH